MSSSNRDTGHTHRVLALHLGTGLGTGRGDAEPGVRPLAAQSPGHQPRSSSVAPVIRHHALTLILLESLEVIRAL